MKHLNTYITEYIVKKKLNKFIDSEDHYEYTPKTKIELLDNIKELFDKGETDLNCIDTSNITDMSYAFASDSSYKGVNFPNNSKYHQTPFQPDRSYRRGCSARPTQSRGHRPRGG